MKWVLLLFVVACVCLVPFSSHDELFVKKSPILTYPACNWRSTGVTPFKFRRDLWDKKLDSLGYRVALSVLSKVYHFDTKPATDRQTLDR